MILYVRPDALCVVAVVINIRSACPAYRASAPETTSMISLVMAACRTLFMYSVRLPIMSAEFFVAVSIAVIWAAKNRRVRLEQRAGRPALPNRSGGAAG